MAVPVYVFAKWMVHATTQDKQFDWDTDTIKGALTTNGWTPNQDTHSVFSDVTNEITGTGYTAGGVTATTKTQATTNNVLALDCDDFVWSSATFSAVRRLVVYDATPAAAANQALMCWGDFGADQGVSGGVFTAQVAASGLVVLTAANAPGFP